MRIPQTIPSLISRALETAVGLEGMRDLNKWLDDMYARLQATLNGNLKYGENIGKEFLWTFNVAANTATDFYHELGRRPTFVHTLVRNSIAAYATSPVIYLTEGNWQGWDEHKVTLRCSEDTSGANSLNFIAIVI